jgi:hypothetical protein
MKLAEFQDRLDSDGSDLALWAQPHRRAAEHLLASDVAARALLVEAQRLDSLIARALRQGATATEASADRVVVALRRPLPPQRRSLLARLWPSALLDFDLAPARWRIAALVGVACLGVVLGLWGPDIGAADGGFAVASASSDVTLAGMSEPEPLTGARP